MLRVDGTLEATLAGDDAVALVWAAGATPHADVTNKSVIAKDAFRIAKHSNVISQHKLLG